jgi:hypothetical protein
LCCVTIKVGVLGARGRVGSEVCRAVERADDLKLMAALGSTDSLDPLAVAEVVIDFTHPDVVMDNLRWCIGRGLHCGVGTTGFDDARLDELRGALANAPGVGVIVAPNFSIGAVLMMRFAETAAPFYESVEIVEMHHPDKAVAPSGTSRRTAGIPTGCWLGRPGPGPGRDHHRPRGSAALRSTASMSTPSGPAGWSRTGSASRRTGRRSPSATTRWTARRSHPGSCSPSAPSPTDQA